MEFLAIKPIAFAVTAAAGYGIATIGMKLASAEWTAAALALILLGFIAATQAEVVLMRSIPLGELYLIIIALETLIVLGYAYSIGEGLSSRDAAGGMLILMGLAIVSH
ncbi:MAG: 5-aminolevulinate synthase [Pseudomonadota bacterium]